MPNWPKSQVNRREIMTPTILFLCPHSAAKSVLAAAYCQQLLQQQGLAWAVEFAGTEPDEAISPAVAQLLAAEGVDVSGYRPRLVTYEQLNNAFHVVSLGCDPADLRPRNAIEQWDDIPPASQDLTAARDLIYGRVAQLVHNLTS
jgi:arsenate reductase (thioredoxin)